MNIGYFAKEQHAYLHAWCTNQTTKFLLSVCWFLSSSWSFFLWCPKLHTPVLEILAPSWVSPDSFKFSMCWTHFPALFTICMLIIKTATSIVTAHSASQQSVLHRSLLLQGLFPWSLKPWSCYSKIDSSKHPRNYNPPNPFEAILLPDFFNSTCLLHKSR